MPHPHYFEAHVTWRGASAGPTSDYASYSREFQVKIEGKPDLIGSAAAPFRGDASLHNPEDLLLAAVSSCHMLSYLAIAARAGVLVLDYTDRATAIMTFKDGKMRITEATLRPIVTFASGTNLDKTSTFHERANQECFIASSVNFPVHHEPEAIVRES